MKNERTVDQNDIALTLGAAGFVVAAPYVGTYIKYGRDCLGARYKHLEISVHSAHVCVVNHTVGIMCADRLTEMTYAECVEAFS